MTTSLYGHLSSAWHNHLGPCHHKLFPNNASAGQPREIISAGLLAVGT